MQKIIENFQEFLTIWGITLVLNQVVLFGGCFHPVCIIAALPHTGVIAFFVSIYFIKDNSKSFKPYSNHHDLDNGCSKKLTAEIKQKLENYRKTYETKRKFFNVSATVLERMDSRIMMWFHVAETILASLDSDSECKRVKEAIQECFNKIQHFINIQTLNEYKVEGAISSKILTATDKKIMSFEDQIQKELKKLKLELKSLESTLQTLTEQKTERLNDIEEFNREYNLRLGGIIRQILNLRREILYNKTIKQQKRKASYQGDLQTLKEAQQTIDELKDTMAQLEEALESIDESHEHYDEIKKAQKELFEELRKLEKDLETQGLELELAKEFIEDETIEEEYEEAQAHYDEYEHDYEQIKESLKDVVELSDYDKAELKKLYKKAARICHPDIVPYELKEKATEMMQLLNEAYAKKDLLKVKEILYLQEKGMVFECSSDYLEDIELLKSKIEEYRKNIKNAESELEKIKQDDTYQTIADLDDWDSYFEELKSELEKEKVQLEEEAREVLKESNEEKKTEKIVQPTKTKPKQPQKAKTITKEDSPYSKHIHSIENLNFERIRRYCNNLADENQADAMQESLATNGRMHKALIFDALEQFYADLNGDTITVIDWGCDQGIASMLVIDYIREKQLNIKVSNVILIDDEPKALSRAMTQVEALSHDKIKSIAMKSDDSTIFETIKSVKNGSVLNLFMNDKMPMDYLEIDYGVFENAYFMCVSHVSQEFVDEIYKNMSDFIDLQEISSRNGKIGRFKRFERIFKISETKHNIPAVDVDDDELPF